MQAVSHAVAVFKTNEIEGEVVASEYKHGCKIFATFTKLPPGKHGFHIHKAGDLRGEGCKGLCEHYDIGHHEHGGAPEPNENRGHGGLAKQLRPPRHTGDLGNVEVGEYHYILPNVSVRDLWGRSMIVHEDEDDLGKGTFEDSKITGHAGKRMGCAIFGRVACSEQVKKNKTRKQRK